MVLELILGSFTHLTSFLYMVYYRGPTSFFYMWNPVFPASFVEKTLLSPIDWTWHTYWKSHNHRHMSLSLHSQFYSIALYVCHYGSTTLELCGKFEIVKCESSKLVFFSPEDSFGYLRSPCNSMWIWGSAFVVLPQTANSICLLLIKSIQTPAFLPKGHPGASSLEALCMIPITSVGPTCPPGQVNHLFGCRLTRACSSSTLLLTCIWG